MIFVCCRNLECVDLYRHFPIRLRNLPQGKHLYHLICSLYVYTLGGLNVFQNSSELCIRFDVAAVHTSLPIRRCCVIVVKYVERVVKRGVDLFGGLHQKFEGMSCWFVSASTVNPSNLFSIGVSQRFPHGGSLNSIGNSQLHAMSERTTGCLLQSNVKLTKTKVTDTCRPVLCSRTTVASVVRHAA